MGVVPLRLAGVVAPKLVADDAEEELLDPDTDHQPSKAFGDDFIRKTCARVHKLCWPRGRMAEENGRERREEQRPVSNRRVI